MPTDDGRRPAGCPVWSPQHLRLAIVTAGLHMAIGLYAPALAAQEVGSSDEKNRAPVGGTGYSQQAEDEPVAQVSRREGAIRIDGRLDEPAWLLATPVTRFVQGEPTEGAAPAESTEVRLLFDDRSLYIGARMYERDPENIQSQLVRRDQDGQYDYFEISLDPNGDDLTGYRFRVGAAGVESDAYLYQDTREDREWDAVWDSGVHRDSLGWSVEMRIPLSQIRYESPDPEKPWGVNFIRRRLASTSLSYFSLESRNVRGKVSQFGRLEGIQLPNQARRLEVRPFFVSQIRSEPVTEGDPFTERGDVSPRLGLDLSYGVTSTFSLDATINPDFGQVEVDPEVINLTAFETFFPELRPFFVQDARVFDFELSGRRNTLFFSRRIGRSPHGGDSGEADFTDVPGQSTILGATKFTGRTASGLSVGLLAAVTDEETGKAFFSDNGEIRDFVVEPRSEFGVLRLQQDLRDGASRVGAIVTALNRESPGDGSFDEITTNAYSAGVDFEHDWGGASDRNWRVFGNLATSFIRGVSEALIRIQESSNHRFQRPDAPKLGVDSTATSMTGVNWQFQFERLSAKHWTWATWMGEISPGFEVNDLGFSTDTEHYQWGARIGYREIQPGSIFRAYSLRLFTSNNFRHTITDDLFSASNIAHSYKSGFLSLNGKFTFLNNWEMEADVSYSPQSLSDSQTRGGPLMTDPASVRFELQVETDPRAIISLEPSVEFTDRALDGGKTFETELKLAFRPAPSWEIRIGPKYKRERDAAQFVTSTDTVAFAPTFGSRYLFADLLRQEFSLETRVDVAFTPNVSLQIFAQPLVSTGNFQTYKQLARPESFDFLSFEEGVASVQSDGEVSCLGGATCVLDGERFVDFDGQGAADFSFGDRDFNIRSLVGNAVFRWEYRSGSTLFIVWQQSRRETEDFGDFSLGRDVAGIFSAPATNTLIVKVSHYLSP